MGHSYIWGGCQGSWNTSECEYSDPTPGWDEMSTACPRLGQVAPQWFQKTLCFQRFLSMAHACLRHPTPGPTPGKVEKESQECTGALTRDRAVLETSFGLKSGGGGSGFQGGRAGQMRSR